MPLKKPIVSTPIAMMHVGKSILIGASLKTGFEGSRVPGFEDSRVRGFEGSLSLESPK